MTNSRRCVCFSGHRLIEKNDVERVNAGLDRVIAGLTAQGYDRFLCGGALGFDTLAARAILRARLIAPVVKLIIVQPCRDQAEKWLEADKQAYRAILEQADEVICLAESYYDGCMQARNRYLIDNSGICVAYCRRERSGTASTVKYAQTQGVKVINLA